MAETTLTNYFREKLALYFYNGSSLPRGTQIALGDGGYDSVGEEVIVADAAQTSLNNVLLTKDITSLSHPTAYSVTAIGTVLPTELIGESISEVGLLDSTGGLIGVRNFAPKIKDNDETYDFEITLNF